MYRPGFPLVAVSQVDVQVSGKAGSPGHASPLPSGPALCEDGRPYVTDPVTGRKVCMCNLGADAPYGPHGLLTGTRKQGTLPGAVGMAPVGFDTAAFYSPLIRGMPIRQDRLPPYLTAGMTGQPLTFDPSMTAHPYGLLYAGMDMNGGPMRKAATRETTGPLKAWLTEHKKNPYPTKAEKIMLAIITRMSLTQVSTWFANARRRLKKENKLFPAGDNRDDDDDDDDISVNHREGNTSQGTGSDKRVLSDSDNEDINVDMSDCSDVDDDVIPSSREVTDGVRQAEVASLQGQGRSLMSSESGHGNASGSSHSSDSSHQNHHHHHHHHQHNNRDKHNHTSQTHGLTPPSSAIKVSPSTTSSSRPKIWSISEIISGPSTASEGSPRRPPGSLQLSVQTNSPLALTKPTHLGSASALSKQPSPLSSATLLTTSSPVSSPTFSSPSPSPISPPAFRPMPPSIMAASPLFIHRPELPGFISRYGLSVHTNGLHMDKPAASTISHSNNFEDFSRNPNARHIPQSSRSQSRSPVTDTELELNASRLNARTNSTEECPETDFRNDKLIKPMPVSAMSSPPRRESTVRSTGAASEKTASSPSSHGGGVKIPSPYKPKTQNAIQNGSSGADVALDLQTKKRHTDT